MKKISTLLLTLTVFLVNSCNEPAQKTSADSFSFAFMTDIHVQAEKKAAEGFMQAIDTVNKLSPDFVITGGDQIMDALGQTESRADSLYTLYNEISESFDMPVYNTLGNHEVFGYYERSGVDTTHPLYGDRMFEERIGERYYSFEHKGWKFYILDSVEEREGRNGYFGFVDDEQIEWLKKDLESVDNKTPVVISVHIPLISVQTQLLSGSTAANSDGIVIKNSKEVLSLFEKHNLKLVLQGHLHFLEDIYAEGVHFITGGAVSASWWNGPRGSLQEGFLMVNVEGNEFDWEYVDYGWEVAVN